MLHWCGGGRGSEFQILTQPEGRTSRICWCMGYRALEKEWNQGWCHYFWLEQLKEWRVVGGGDSGSGVLNGGEWGRNRLRRGQKIPFDLGHSKVERPSTASCSYMKQAVESVTQEFREVWASSANQSHFEAWYGIYLSSFSPTMRAGTLFCVVPCVISRGMPGAQ